MAYGKREEITMSEVLDSVFLEYRKISEAPVTEYDTNLYKSIDNKGVYLSRNPHSSQLVKQKGFGNIDYWYKKRPKPEMVMSYVEALQHCKSGGYIGESVESKKQKLLSF